MNNRDGLNTLQQSSDTANPRDSLLLPAVRGGSTAARSDIQIRSGEESSSWSSDSSDSDVDIGLPVSRTGLQTPVEEESSSSSSSESSIFVPHTTPNGVAPQQAETQNDRDRQDLGNRENEHGEEDRRNGEEESLVISKRKSWRWRCVAISGLLFIAAGIIVWFAIPSDEENNNNKGTDDANSQKSPSQSPTVHFDEGETTLALATVVVQLDDKPEETGWKINCGQKSIADFPTGVYQQRSNRLVTEQVQLRLGEECFFAITDSASNGIDGGFYRVHYGAKYNTNTTLLMQGSGNNFADRHEESFEVLPPSTISPAPSKSPRPSFYPTTSLTASPSQTPSPSTTQRPTRLGAVSSSPTAARPTIFTPTTSATPRPTRLETIYVTVVIQLDEFPSETGWSLECIKNGGAVSSTFSVPPLTYGKPYQRITESKSVPNGAECNFTLTDVFGDGICCTFAPPRGFYQVFMGTRSSMFFNLVGEGGEFGAHEELTFTATS